MTDYEKLTALLAETPYLSADTITREVSLIPRDEAVRLLMHGDGQLFPTTFIVDLERALHGLAKMPDIGKNNRSFSLKKVALVEGVSYRTAYKHAAISRLFEPTDRGFTGCGSAREAKFSWCDIFVAGTVGCLYRQGFPLDVLAKVQPLLTAQIKTPRRRVRLVP